MKITALLLASTTSFYNVHITFDQFLRVIIVSLIVFLPLLILITKIADSKELNSEKKLSSIKEKIRDFVYKHEFYLIMASVALCVVILIGYEMVINDPFNIKNDNSPNKRSYFYESDGKTLLTYDQVLAAEHGSPVALYDITLNHLKGENGVPKDEEKALEWLRKAGEHGSVFAQYELGRMHEMNGKLTYDDNESLKWYLKAAEQMHRQAQSHIATLYMYGTGGVEKDLIKAYMWFAISKTNGKTLVEKHLSKEDLKEAKYLVYRWKKKYCKDSYCSFYNSDEGVFPTKGIGLD